MTNKRITVKPLNPEDVRKVTGEAMTACAELQVRVPTLRNALMGRNWHPDYLMPLWHSINDHIEELSELVQFATEKYLEANQRNE